MKTKKIRVACLGEVPRVYHEAWAVYEALRRLGFADDDIITEVQPGFDAGEPHGEMLHVVLRAQGLEFTYTVAPVDRDFDGAREYWFRLREAISTGAITEPELFSLWKSSRVGGDVEHFATLAALITAKGFRIPAAAN